MTTFAIFQVTNFRNILGDFLIAKVWSHFEVGDKLDRSKMQSMLKACQAANKGQLLQASSRAVALGNAAETTVAEPVTAVAAVPKGLCENVQRSVLPKFTYLNEENLLDGTCQICQNYHFAICSVPCIFKMVISDV